jgi:hypothetical protein
MRESVAVSAAPPAFRIVDRAPVLGDDWLVLGPGDVPISDLSLARRAKDRGLAAELESTRLRFALLCAGESLLGGAALLAGGYGTYRGLQRDGRSHGGDWALAGGGFVGAVALGGLALFHLVRALDVSAPRPAWHHLERERAEALGASAAAVSAPARP